MKVIYLNIALLFGSLIANAQVRPFLIDPGSNIGSGTITLKYKHIKEVEKDIKKELNKLITDYSQRTIYLITTQILIDDINDEVTNSLNRYSELSQRNESLSSLFSYTTKKDNRKKLKIVLTMLHNIRNELRGQGGLTVVYGEKLNLYQNTSQSLTDINRIMDNIEEEIEKKKLIRRILN